MIYKTNISIGSVNKLTFLSLLLTIIPTNVLAFGGDTALNLYMTNSAYGIIALVLFVLAYVFVMGEEFLHLRKSKPVILAAGFIWILVALAAKSIGASQEATNAIRYNLLEYAELFLFLLVAMTYVNAMEERQVFEALRSWLVKKGFSYRKLFWITGILAFFISPIADNLTTALLMCAVVMAVGKDKPKFVALSCINIVVAANAGGAYSPFGDITTLMVWQKGVVPFQNFFQIFIPSAVNYLVPAFIMSFAVPKGVPDSIDDHAFIHYGGKVIIGLFILTIFTAVSFHNFLHLPPAVGMMTGLAYLQFFGYYLKKKKHTGIQDHYVGEIVPFDIFKKIQLLEWDTLLFFYGIVLCVGGLATFGYLHLLSDVIYNSWGAGLPEIHKQTPANITIGLISAIIDNIPVMYAVLTMYPTMSEGQWLLVTLTAGVGGSLLSIGSAAGVALMGQANGMYTFFSHLKWTWAIFLGYLASIWVHVWWNQDLFHMTVEAVAH